MGTRWDTLSFFCRLVRVTLTIVRSVIHPYVLVVLGFWLHGLDCRATAPHRTTTARLFCADDADRLPLTIRTMILILIVILLFFVVLVVLGILLWFWWFLTAFL